MNKPDLYSLLKQFAAIGGMAEIGQPGFCLLMALWQKANELNWVSQFAMTNTELLYRSGYNSEKAMIAKRNQLTQLGYFKYTPPKNRRRCGTYTMNYNLLDYFLKHSSENSISESIPESRNGNSAESSVDNIKNDLSSKSVSLSNSSSFSKTRSSKKTKPNQTRKTYAATSAARQPNPAVKRMIDLYHDLFKAKFGQAPVIDGKKDGELFRRMLLVITEEKMVDILHRFFDSQDKFIVENGYSVGALKTRINSFLANPKQLAPMPRAFASILEVMEGDDSIDKSGG